MDSGKFVGKCDLAIVRGADWAISEPAHVYTDAKCDGQLFGSWQRRF
jgi:hypothetical protein